MSGQKTALVLSGGAMFGAWQAGVWRVLSRRLRPDVVIGASIGALNAWAIAGGCDPDQLAALWLDQAFADVTRLRLPWPPWDGIFDSGRLERAVRRVHDAFRPRLEIGVPAIQVRGLRPRLFRNEEISARHLHASCAMAFGFRLVPIDGKLYTDGGLLAALPLWAAPQMDATRVIGIHCMPKLPSVAGRAVLRTLKQFVPSPQRPPATSKVEVLVPSRPMGSLRDLCFWKRENIERWIQLGESDAKAFLAGAQA